MMEGTIVDPFAPHREGRAEIAAAATPGVPGCHPPVERGLHEVLRVREDGLLAVLRREHSVEDELLRPVLPGDLERLLVQYPHRRLALAVDLVPVAVVSASTRRERFAREYRRDVLLVAWSAAPRFRGPGGRRRAVVPPGAPDALPTSPSAGTARRP